MCNIFHNKKIPHLVLIMLIVSLISGICPWQPDHTGWEAYAASGTNAIKVGLRYATKDTTATITSASGSLALGSVSGMTFTKSLELNTDTVTLTLASGAVSVSDASGNLLATLTGSGSECIASSANGLGGQVKFSSKTYRGGIVPYINKSGQMNIINYLSLDDYARGVVGPEIGSSSHIEALKAQAMAAKNFAVCTTKHSAQGFDVCTTTNCQVYSGVSTETANINKAVDAVAGKLMYYQGQLITGYFFSNSGGATENSEDVWSTTIGYLRSVKDPYSPDDPWTATLTFADIASKVGTSKVGTVTNVQITGTNASGYVSELTITGTSGTVTLKKDAIRTTLGSTKIKSRKFTISVTGSDGSTTSGTGTTGSSSGTASGTASGSSSGLPAGTVSTGSTGTGTGSATGTTVIGSTNATQTTSNAVNYTISSGSSKATMGDTVSLVSDNGTVTTVNKSGLVIYNGSAKTVVAAADSAETDDRDSAAPGTTTVKACGANSKTLAAAAGSAGTVTFSGQGYGHGVGLSQKSAQVMANQGMTYDQILKFFYTGIEIK